MDNHSTKSKILIPHNTKLNNYKSNKYFSLDNNHNWMKEALTKYREKSQKNEKNDSINRTQPSYSSTIDISNINVTKQKFNKNNTIKFDKNLLNYAEPRTKVKEFHKIQPKVIDSFFAEENIENIFENDFDNEDKKEDFSIGTGNKRKKELFNNNNGGRYNKSIKMKNKKKLNLSITDTNDNEETIINENDYDDDSFYNENEKNGNQNIKINKKNTNFNLNEINLEYLLIIEKLYNELMKDLEINKMEIYQNKLSIIKDFIYIFNSQDSYYLFDIIESKKLNNDLLLKEFIVEELVFFYIILLIGLFKKEKNSFHSGLHNLSFYFHQSFIIFIYIIVTNIHFDNNTYKDNEMMSNYKKSMQIFDENKTWLDKNNYKTYLQNNNSISKQILMNILKQIKQNFQSNSNIISKKNVKKKKNSNFMNDNNEIIEDCKNIFMSYLKSYKSIKITDIIKEIKNYSPINELYEVVKMDKIISQFSESKNGNNETVFEDFNVENNIYNNEMPKEPFLKPINPKYKYTLVLDLDETLVHYISDNESAYIQIRPGAENFLKELSEFYEIVIFTAALQTYADLVIDGIDPDGVISDRLYRQHTINVGNINIKDLDKLGRDIKHIIIIDNFMENYSLQPKNGLNIIDFEGNEYDDELEYLKEDLLKLVKLNPNDVRPYLTDIQRGMDKRAIYFQKVINDKKFKEEELMNDNNKNNNLFDEILNDNNFNYNCDERINTESKNRKNEKGYSFTEESDNV